MYFSVNWEYFEKIGSTFRKLVVLWDMLDMLAIHWDLAYIASESILVYNSSSLGYIEITLGVCCVYFS